MKKTIKIHIPKPCHEDWGKMTASEKGKHCTACEKEVVDFTNKTDEEIHKLATNGSKMCGRFKTTQVGRDITLARKQYNPLPKIAASLLIPAAILSMQEITGQTNVPKTTQVASITNLNNSLPTQSEESTEQTITINPYNNRFILKGVVLDESGPLPGADITIKGTPTRTQSDFDGNFELEVSINDILQISYVIYDTKEITVTSNTKIQVVLEGGELMGDIIIGIMVVPEEDFPSITNPNRVQFGLSDEQQQRKSERKAYREKRKAWKDEKKARHKDERKKNRVK